MRNLELRMEKYRSKKALSLIPSKKGRIFDIGAERKTGREAQRIDDS